MSTERVNGLALHFRIPDEVAERLRSLERDLPFRRAHLARVLLQLGIGIVEKNPAAVLGAKGKRSAVSA